MVTSPATPANDVPESIEKEYAAYEQLSPDEKLGLLWVLYKNMGGSITPAAPGAANAEFTQSMLSAAKEMSDSDQMKLMRNIITKQRTEETESYYSFSADNKLLFWYQLAEGMAAGEIVQVPDDYEQSKDGLLLFNDITKLEFNEQITFLRHAVI